jgi:hypothetical protein
MKHIEGLLLTSSGTISAPGLRPAFQLPRATPRYKGRCQHVFESYNAGPRCRHPFPPQLLKLYSKKHILCTDGKRVAMDHGGNSGSSFRKVPRWPLVQGSWPSGHDHSMYYTVMNRFVGNSLHRCPVAPIISRSTQKLGIASRSVKVHLMSSSSMMARLASDSKGWWVRISDGNPYMNGDACPPRF